MARDKWGTPTTATRAPLIGAVLGVSAIMCFITAAVIPGILDRRDAALPMPSDAIRPVPQPYTLPLEYAQWVIRYCDETGVPVWLACRLFAWESGWRAGYVSVENENGTRDFGLAALNSSCIEAFSAYNEGRKVDPHDPETAIRVGVRYLAALYAETGSWRAAVGCYNVGLAGWRAGKRPLRHIRGVIGE